MKQVTDKEESDRPTAGSGDGAPGADAAASSPPRDELEKAAAEKVECGSFTEAAELYRQAGNFRKASQCCREAGICAQLFREDHQAAFNWFRKALELDPGNAEALCDIGLACCLGRGVPQDTREGLAQLRKVESYDGWYLIGLMYQEGVGDIPRDFGEALKAFRKAASMNGYDEAAGKYPGDGRAEYTLGNLCLEGKGLPPDRARAVAWFKIAAACGNGEARQALKDLGCSEAAGGDRVN